MTLPTSQAFASGLRKALSLLAVVLMAGCGDPRALSGPTAESEATKVDRDRATLSVVEGLGGGSVVAAAVNRSLQVVGTAETAEGDSHAFLWARGTVRDLGTLGGGWSTAADINDWGQVTGTSVTAAGEARAYFWADGTMYEIGTLGGRESHGVAVNDRGEVAGYSTTAEGEVHAFLWSHGRMRDLGTLGGSGSYSVALNEDGEVVGRSTTEAGKSHAFRWSEGEMVELGSGAALASSGAVDVSARGHVLINARENGRGRAYVWSEGDRVSLDAPSGATAVSSDVNARGQAVGQISSSSVGTWPVLWRNGRAVRLHPSGDGSGGRGTALALNDAGQVTGLVRPAAGSGYRAFFWANGESRTLDPVSFDRMPERTAGIAVTESGAVLVLASHASGDVRSLLWHPSPAHPSDRGGRLRKGRDRRVVWDETIPSHFSTGAINRAAKSLSVTTIPSEGIVPFRIPGISRLRKDNHLRLEMGVLAETIMYE